MKKKYTQYIPNRIKKKLIKQFIAFNDMCCILQSNTCRQLFYVDAYTNKSVIRMCVPYELRISKNIKKNNNN